MCRWWRRSTEASGTRPWFARSTGPDDDARHEGYVVRLEGGFDGRNFSRSVAKYVRARHVQTDTHWMHGPITPNGFA